MITEVAFKEKVAKLMAMAGTDGDSYCEWTINQIVHGLRGAVTGATIDRVRLAISQLEEDGVVIEKVRNDKGVSQYALSEKVPAPEPLNESPVVISVAHGAGKAGHISVAAEPALPNRMVMDSINARLDNLEEVMSDLNREVGVTKDRLKDLRSDVAKQNPKFSISETTSSLRRELGQRIGKTEIKVEGMAGTLDAILKAIRGGVENLADEADDAGDGVQVVEQDPKEEQLSILMKHWEAMAAKLTDDTPRSMGEMGVCEGQAKAFRSCAEDLKHVLAGTRVFVAAGG